MKILSFFQFFFVIFALLDPDPQFVADPDLDPSAQINADPDTDLDPKPWLEYFKSNTTRTRSNNLWELQSATLPLCHTEL
jgi:hypothetical protein